MRVERGVIGEFWKVIESERGWPLKEKNRESRVFWIWGKRESLRLRRVRLGSRVRARVGIWSSGDSMKI